MDFFNTMPFGLLIFIKTVPVFLVKIVILYFVIKFAVKNALKESQKSQKEKENAK